MAASIKRFVVDASFVLASFLPDEESPEPDEVIRRHINGEIELVSAYIFELEVFNGLRSAALQKRITREDSLAIAENFLKLGIRCEPMDTYRAFLLAINGKLSVYDATYVCLAKTEGIKLLTLDRKMERLAKGKKN